MKTKLFCSTSRRHGGLVAPCAPYPPAGCVLLPESSTSHPCASLSFQEYMKGAFCLRVFVSRGFLSKSAARRFPAPPAPPLLQTPPMQDQNQLSPEEEMATRPLSQCLGPAYETQTFQTVTGRAKLSWTTVRSKETFKESMEIRRKKNFHESR